MNDSTTINEDVQAIVAMHERLKGEGLPLVPENLAPDELAVWKRFINLIRYPYENN